MDDLDPDTGAAAWSGAVVEHPAVIDDGADLEPIPAPLDLVPDLGVDLDGRGEPIPASDDTDRTPILVDDELHLPGPVLPDDLDLTHQDSAPEAPDDGVHGNPAAWTLNWFFQQLDGYCGPSAVAQVVSQATGADITDPQQLVDRAVELGLMVDGDPSQGMTLPNMEILLEDQGVPCTVTDSSLDDLRQRLDDGYGVIAMVDSGEIWLPNQETGEDNTPDHVLVVAGIDDTRGVVILSDPGVPSGNQLEIPIEQFENAWADSGHKMLVTDAPDSGLTDAAAAPAGGRSAIIDL